MKRGREEEEEGGRRIKPPPDPRVLREMLPEVLERMAVEEWTVVMFSAVLRVNGMREKLGDERVDRIYNLLYDRDLGSPAPGANGQLMRFAQRIRQHFPDLQPKWKYALASLVLRLGVSTAMDQLLDRMCGVDGKVLNVDAPSQAYALPTYWAVALRNSLFADTTVAQWVGLANGSRAFRELPPPRTGELLLLPNSQASSLRRLVGFAAEAEPVLFMASRTIDDAGLSDAVPATVQVTLPPLRYFPLGAVVTVDTAVDDAQMDLLSLITLVPAGPTAIRPDSADVPTTTFLEKRTGRPVLGVRVRVARRVVIDVDADSSSVTLYARISLAWLNVEALLDAVDKSVNPAFWNVRIPFHLGLLLSTSWGDMLTTGRAIRQSRADVIRGVRRTRLIDLGHLARRLFDLVDRSNWPADWTSDWVLGQLQSLPVEKPDQPHVYRRDYQD